MLFYRTGKLFPISYNSGARFLPNLEYGIVAPGRELIAD